MEFALFGSWACLLFGGILTVMVAYATVMRGPAEPKRREGDDERGDAGA